jgi:hypothetical protein
MWRCRSPTQKALCTEVFIEVGPVDAVTTAGNLPMFQLFQSGMEELRVPSEGHTDHSAVF